MSPMYSYDTYLSPNTWRYGTPQMRQIWSERYRRVLMRRVWVALATAQHEAGLVSAEQLTDLQAHVDRIDIERAHEIERETRHDVMAEIRCYAEQATIGGGIIHWGATSADINDNVNALRLREAAQMIAGQLRELLLCFADRVDQSAETPVMAHTHIQPAEPTTLGYRFSVYAQDLYEDWLDLERLIGRLRGKGFKGAVGTQASYQEILHGTGQTAQQMEARAMQVLDLPVFPITTQTYTRQQDLRVVNVIAGMASSMHKFAMDFRVLQSPPFGEWAEPFGKKQVGSSAMPFKRNPINMENICSMARYVAAMPNVLWDNASQAILERSLDDSANRRFVFPEAFLATNEMLKRMTRIVKEMRLNESMMARNMATYGPFAATERVLMALVSNGASRQDAHEWIRDASLAAWGVVQVGGENPLVELLQKDANIAGMLSADAIDSLMHAEAHVGNSAERARQFAQHIRTELQASE
ncbi:MAG: adenylosuccinate lyase [Candidatus Promineifilaceae bacterium]